MQVGEPCICRLSHVLESLHDVRELHLSGNDLQNLPDSIWALTHLEKLDLSHNRLHELSGDVVSLQSLQVGSSYSDLTVSSPVSQGLHTSPISSAMVQKVDCCNT